jgi:hypothetical protein
MEAPTSTTIDTSCDCDGGEDELAKNPPKRRRGYIPYSTIYESQDEVRKNGYWIPGIPVEATIIKVQRDTSSGYHILNPFMLVKVWDLSVSVPILGKFSKGEGHPFVFL